mgnify:FL=1
MTYERLVDQAEAMVNIVHKKYLSGNKMAYPALLSGIGNFCIESYPGAGHNYQAVVDAIHNCYARDHAAGFDVGYKAGLETMRNTGKDIQNILDYQKKKEQAGTAQFHIDLEQGEIVYG